MRDCVIRRVPQYLGLKERVDVHVKTPRMWKSTVLSMTDEVRVFGVVEELPHDFLIESLDPISGQAFTSFVLGDALLVLPKAPDGGLDTHEAVFELNVVEVEGANTDSNLISQVAVVSPPIVANDVIDVGVVLAVGLDVVVTVVGERHHRTDVAGGNKSGRAGDGIDGTLSDVDDWM
jgi:hypothetical protein